MRAAVLASPGRADVVEVPIPEPSAGQVRVRLEGCGVCASNLGPWAGPDWMEFPTRPGDLGHEGWGIVDRVGEGVDDIAEGDRVAALSYNAYGEFDLADATAVVKLPEELSGQPFPGEPLGCAMNIFARSEIRTGQIVAVVGAGFIGALLIQLASAAGATVIAISRRRSSLEAAKTAGAAHCIPLHPATLVTERVMSATGSRLCDCVIEAAGVQDTLDIATDLVRERGRLVIAGYHQDGLRQINMQQWNWRGIDVINAHERNPAVYVRGIRDAVEAVLTGHLRPSSLYTHEYPLEDLGKALDATRDRPDGFMKAFVRP